MKRIVTWLLLTCLLCAALPSAVFAAESKNVVFCTGINKVCINKEEVVRISDSTDTRPFLSGIDVYLPLAFTLEQFGGSCKADGDILTMTMPNGAVWYASVYRSAIWQRTNKVMHFKIKTKNDVIFISLDALAKYAGLQYQEEEGMVVLANGGNAPKLTDSWIADLQSELYYERPTAERILADLQKQNAEEAHPRLLARPDDFERIRTLVKTDELMATWYEQQKNSADKALETMPPRWELRDGLRLLYVSQEVRARVLTLGLVYQVEQDPKYAERMWQELECVTDYINWHPEHALDTGTMLTAVAIGYDWCYDYFTQSQRDKIAGAIYKLGLTPMWQQYQGTFVPNDTSTTYWASRGAAALSEWTRGDSNWNSWVNSGIILACLAIADEYETEFCTNFIEEALHRLENVLPAYAPDGASEEGVGYGLISAGYLQEIFAGLGTALGTDYDYIYVPGIAELADFPTYMNGPAGKFNYHDAGNESKQYMPETFFFANRLDKPTLATQRLQGLKAREITNDIKDILWYRPDLYENAGEAEEMELDKYFRKVETGSFRSSWEDPYAFYLTFHGGENNVSHMHYDAGTFVMDAMGERWACDLGTDQFTYTSTPHNRYDVYRVKAEGHNTLYINPSIAPDQELDAWNPVETYVSQPAGGFAVMNLTQAYKSQVTSARRGFALTDNRTKAIIQDEITLTDKSEIYWGMHTRASIEISADKKTAILTQNGKRLRASLISEDGVFEALPAEQLPQSGRAEGQTADPDVSKLAVHIENATQTTICVEFTCVMEEEDLEKETGTVVPLDDWAISGSGAELPTLENIYVDGEPLEDFKPSIKNYNLYLPLETDSVPEITADGGANTVEVIPPASYENSLCRIEVKDESGAHSIYYLQLMIKPEVGTPQGLVKLPIVGATASGFQNISGEYHPPQDAIDGNLNTRWTVQGDGQWLEVDLGESKTVNFVSLSFASGDVRSYTFDIQISEDGEDWKTIYSGNSTAMTTGMETHKVEEATGRYVRYVCHGYSGTPNGWNNINEIELYAKK